MSSNLIVGSMQEYVHTIPVWDLEPHFVVGTCPCNPEIRELEDGRINVAHFAWEDIGQKWANVETDVDTEMFIYKDGEVIHIDNAN